MVAAKPRLTSIFARVLAVLIMLSALTAITRIQPTAAAPNFAPTDPGPTPVGGLARIGRGAIYEQWQSPNEKRLALGTELGIYMYDLATMRQLWFKPLKNYFGLQFSADSKWLLGIVGPDIIAWNVENGAQYRKYTPKFDFDPYLATYSKDGKYIITTDGFYISAIEAKSGKILYEIYDEEIYEEWSTIDTSPDNTMFAVGGWWGEFIDVYDIATGTLIRRFATEVQYEDFASTMLVRFSRDGKYLTAGMDNGMLITWNAQTGEFLHRQQIPEWGIAEINYSADGTQFVVGSGSVYVFDTVSGSLLRSYPSLPYSWYGPYFSVSGHIHTLDFSDDGFRLWDVDTNSVIVASTAHAPALYSGAITPDGKTLLLGRETGAIEKWKSQTRERVSVWAGEEGPTSVLAVSPNGLHVATIPYFNRNYIHIWDIATNAKVLTLDLSTDSTVDRPFRAVYTPDGTLWVSSNGGVISQWDTTTGAMLRKFDAYAGSAHDATVSPNGQRIAFWVDNGIITWDVATNALITTVPYFTDDFGRNGVFAAEFTKDGLRIAAADFDFIKVFDTTNGKEVFSFDISTMDYATTMAISADSRVLAVGHDDGVISLWNIKTGRKIRTLDGHGTTVNWLGFSPLNGQLISVSSDGTAVFWPRP